MPKFETDKDRARQHSAVRTFCYEYSFYENDMGEFSAVDYSIHNKKGRTVAYFEVKGCPNKLLRNTETVIVSIRKIQKLQEHQEDSGVPVIICWAFEDGICFTKIDDIKGNIFMGERKGRPNAAHDKELLFSGKTKDFYKIHS
jgi:hypothetical protein